MLRKAWAGRPLLPLRSWPPVPRGRARHEIAASFTESATLSSIAIFSSSRAILSAASSSRWRALRFTCGAPPPWVAHVVPPRIAHLRHRSPERLCAVHRRAWSPGRIPWVRYSIGQSSSFPPKLAETLTGDSTPFRRYQSLLPCAFPMRFAPLMSSPACLASQW